MFTDGYQYCNRRRISRDKSKIILRHEYYISNIININVIDNTTTTYVLCIVMDVNVVIVVESSENNQR